jgi:hypothetical protein
MNCRVARRGFVPGRAWGTAVGGPLRASRLRSCCAASRLLRILVLAGMIPGVVGPMAARASGPLPEVLTGEAIEHSDARVTLHARIEQFRYRDGPVMELTGNREFRGGVVVDGGRIVLIPRVGQFVAEYDPGTGQLVRTARHGQPGGFGFGSVIDGALVVMTPRGSRHIGLYDSGTQQYRDGAAHGQASDNAFLGSAMVRPDLVVFAPLNARVIGLYDPQTDTYRDGPQVPDQGHYLFSDIRVSSRTGEVIFTPFDSAHVGIYDPEKHVYFQGPPHRAGTTAAYSGIAELDDGTMVMAPRNAKHVGLYNPETRTFTQGPEHGEGPAAFMAAQRWPGGQVVMAPYRASNVGIYDPRNGQYRSGPSVAHVPVLSHGQRFSGAILTAAGDQIVMSNRGADRLGIIEATESFTAGRPATVWFQYRDAEPQGPWQQTEKTAMIGSGPFQAALRNLPRNRGYEYRAVAVYQGQTVTGEIRRFGAK